MAIKVNQTGVSHAKSLIAQGKVDRESSWEFSAEDGNKILGDNNWSEYKKWFLAVDTEENEDTKGHYKFPYGKNGKVYRSGVIAAKQRAAQQGYTDVMNAADGLLKEIDKGKEEKEDSSLLTRPEETEDKVRVPVPGEEGKHKGHKIRTIRLSDSQGIQALYCVDCRKIITYIFDKSKGWTMEKAKKWVSEHTKNKKSSTFETRAPATGEIMWRSFPLTVKGIVDEENKIVEVTFSSEYPVERWFGREILLHREDCVDLTPLLEVGSIHVNHNPNLRVAKPLAAWIDESDKRGHALIQFKNTEESLRIYQEVMEELLRGTSVGYRVREWKRLEEGEEYEGHKGPAWLGVRWEVPEFSLTSVPADPKVGIGRSESIEMQMQTTKEGDMAVKNDEVKKTNDVDVESIRKEAFDEGFKKGVEYERARIAEIDKWCNELGLVEKRNELIESGVSVDEARKAILEELSKRSKPIGVKPNLGYDPKAVGGEMTRDQVEELAKSIVSTMQQVN